MPFDQPPDKVWTYDDLEQLPQDGTRYEILDGELFVMTGPSLLHQRVLRDLSAIFVRELHDTRIAEVLFAPFDVILSPTKVVQPDLLVFRWERRKVALAKRGAEQAPDLVVEVISPSNPKHDRTRKRRFYARNGIREYWLVDLDAQSIEVLELIEGGLSYRQSGWYGPGDTARSVTFELAVSVDALFRDDD